MCDDYAGLEESLRSVVARLEPASLCGPDARSLTTYFGRLRRIAAAAEVLCAARVAETKAFLGDGGTSPAAWFARESGSLPSEAGRQLDAAAKLGELPDVADAFRSGELSGPQLEHVAATAAIATGSERDLLDAARTHDLAGLKRHCAARQQAVRSREQEAERYERIRRSRHLRHFIDEDGAIRLSARLTPDAGARLLAAIDQASERYFAEARRSGVREPNEAYRADALVDLLTRQGGGASAGPRALVRLRVDLSALRRGEVAGGEQCEIPGVGPVAVQVARELTGDAILEAFIASGSDVHSVCHLGRSLPARLRQALEARDPCCVVPGCGRTRLLEIDHCKIPFAEGGQATLDNLARLCRHHHRLKTYRGYALLGGPGNWVWREPDGTEHRDPAALRRQSAAERVATCAMRGVEAHALRYLRSATAPSATMDP